MLLVLIVSVSLFAGNFEKGLEAYDRADYQTALKLWKMEAEQGNANAQYNLGFLYDNGQGVKKDFVSAVKYLERAMGLGEYLSSFTTLYHFKSNILKNIW